MDLVNFRNSLTSPSQGPASPEGPNPQAGGSPLHVLRGLNAQIVEPDMTDEEENLLKLVDEVTKDEGPGAFGGSMSSIPGAGGSTSMTMGGVFTISPTLQGQAAVPSGAPGYNKPPSYEDKIASASASFAGGNWSIGSPERPENQASAIQQLPIFTSSPEPSATGPAFPNSSMSEAPKYTLTPQQHAVSAPPPPTGGAPPSFATAVASMASGATVSPSIGAAPPPPPPQSGPHGRMPETMIVRNEHGVFLLQPVGSTSPVAGPVPHGNSPIPSSMGAPPPPPGRGSSQTSAPPAYGSARPKNAGTPTPAGTPAPPPPPPPPPGTSPIPGRAGSRGPPAYGESPASSVTGPPPYALPPPGSAPLVSGGTPQAGPAAVGGTSLAPMDGLPPPPPPGPPPAQSGGNLPPPPPPYGGGSKRGPSGL